jgi:hypothetical protein
LKLLDDEEDAHHGRVREVPEPAECSILCSASARSRRIACKLENSSSPILPFSDLWGISEMRRLLLLLPGVVAWPALMWSAVAAADPIGQVKTASGAVMVVHDGASRPLAIGDRVFQADLVSTGQDGSVGITFADNCRLSLGSSSELVLDRFEFNTTTHQGKFDSSLKAGTLAVKSGQIVEQTPEAMTITTPAAVLGIRGTELVVRADAGQP